MQPTANHSSMLPVGDGLSRFVARKFANTVHSLHGLNSCSRLASHPGSISIISVWRRVFTDASRNVHCACQSANSFVMCIFLDSHGILEVAS